MVKALSLGLRVRVLKAVSEGASHRAVAERSGVSAASVGRWRTQGEPGLSGIPCAGGRLIIRPSPW
jgi:transposase